MDPYIEACDLWGDFQHSLIAEMLHALGRLAPRHYLARGNRREYIVVADTEEKIEYPSPPHLVARLRQLGSKPTRKKSSASGVEPAVMRAFVEEEHREPFAEIFEASSEPRLITRIEVLSPSNKRPGSDGRNLYLRCRQRLMRRGVNLVEIDLLRGGERMPMLDSWPSSPYTLMVARAKRPHACLVWQGHWRKPLPTIRVPLLKPDPDLDLDLQPMIAAIYQRSRYAQSIDYTRSLGPPLAAEDAAWLEGRLCARKRRE
jgi:hypothetical protein